MAEHDLPDGPRQLFERVRGPLARAFQGEHNIRFGGGTALAARWAHRHSTDVDLFVEDHRYRDFQLNAGGRFILDLTASAPVNRLAIDRDDTYISFHGLDGHITINPGALTAEPRSPDTVHGTDLPFETTNEILGKKLVFRMAQRRTILSQDLYDIAWANRHDPAELAQAFQAVRQNELAEIVEAFDDHAASGRELAPLLHPSDARLEKQARAIVEQLVREESHVRGPGPDHDRGPQLTRDNPRPQ